VGIQATLGKTIPANIQKFQVGALSWWDYMTAGGVNFVIFGGGGKGWIDGDRLQRTKGAR
jgi:hypothetical protein